MNEKRWLSLILAFYTLLAFIHSLVTPVMEAWDEPWHYPVVQYLATHGLQLPVQDPAIDAPYRQQGNQPPLYYIISAVLTAAIDTSDMEMLRRMNPHAAIGFSQPDGNINLIVHRTEMELFPFQGTTLAVMVIRWFSILLGAGTILITYQLGRELFSCQPVIALGAAALNAFLPMFIFISASVSNDNLSNLIGNGLTLVVVRLLKSQTLPDWRTYALLGVAAGAGLLSKLSIGFFIPLIALALLIVSLRLRDWRPLVVGGLISGALTILIAGWWYWRNMQLYGDPTGLDMFLDIVGRRVPPANWAQLWSERFSFARSYWGAYGSINILLPDGLYALFDTIGIFALLSALAYLIKLLTLNRIKSAKKLDSTHFSPSPTRGEGVGDEGNSWIPLAVTLIWPMLAFISLIRWTTETPGSQGRLLFIALSSLSLWMAVGLVWWLPKRFKPLPIFAVSGYFFLVALIAPFTVVIPAYAAPQTVSNNTVESSFSAPDGTLIGLTGAKIDTPTAKPGEIIFLSADWTIQQTTSRDWSLFLHLLTPEGVILAQRDIYPGGGKLATSDLRAGYGWHNPLAVILPYTAYAPTTLDARIGWYHLPTGERLTLENGEETISIGTIELQPRESQFDVPNPLRINFDNQIELIGYKLSGLSAHPGETIELTLYWRGLQKIENDYVVFANIIHPPTLTKYADSNAMPAAWTRPTTTWQPGEIIEDTHTLNVYTDALPGIYEVEIGLYLQEETFPRLRIVPEVGSTADNFFHLTRVRILEQE